MRKKLLNNLGLKLASVVLAFILWFLVVSIEDPPDTKDYSNIQVKLINTELLEQEGKVYEILDNTDRVRVTVRAPKSIINQLRHTDIVAEADVGKLTDINTIAINYYVENLTVDQIEGNHDVVRLNVEEKTSKWIRLVSNTVGEVAEGYIVAGTTLDQTNIEISGPESAVSKVEYAGVDISVAGVSTSLSANIDIELYDAEGKVVNQDNIKKNADSAHMFVEVLATKEVPVQMKYSGTPAEGYLATGVVENSIDTIMLAGTNAALANVNVITVPEERININGKTGNVIETVNIKEYLPDNIRFADKKFDGRVTATIYIEPVMEKGLLVPVNNVAITNLPVGFTVEMPEGLEGYSIVVSGLKQYIEPMQPVAVTGTVDIAAWMIQNEMEELTEGTYSIPVAFSLSDEITVTEPVNVELKIVALEVE